MPDTLTITPSFVPQHRYRKPFLTYELRHDREDTTKLFRVAIANAPLPCGRTAVLELDAFNDLMDRGFSDQWWAHSNGGRKTYIRTTHRDNPGKMFTVARLLAGGGWGTRTRYRDKDTYNLRQNNLKVGEGFSEGCEAAVMTDPDALAS